MRANDGTLVQLSVGMRIIAAGRSDVGLQREHNEDSFVVLARHGLYVVADGMGGHRAGDVASKMATESLIAFFESTAREDATWPFQYDPALTAEENRLLTGIKVANKSVYEASARNAEHRGMGTTVVGVLLTHDAEKVYVGHVGDSRCYRIRDGEIRQLTQDHSLINEYIRAMPELTEAQRDDLPRNVITRALGMTEGVAVDMFTDSTVVGDVYILCSDGLSGMITDGEIHECIGVHEDPDDACIDLIRRANDHGGEDNVTAVVIRVVDEAAPPPQRRESVHVVVKQRDQGPVLAPTPPAGTPVLDDPTHDGLRVTDPAPARSSVPASVPLYEAPPDEVTLPGSRTED